MTTKTISSAPGFRATVTAALICAAFCLLASPAAAATNDLSTALQRGLFEEEANQNLGAAIQAYQTVAGQFDKDRKLAATAIFRLGECYRKQGNANAAAVEYERILREFSDQPTLVTLSRQNLAALGSAPPSLAASETAAANPAAAAEAEAVTLEAQIAELKALPKDKLGIAVQQSFPNPVLTSLMQKRMEAEQKLTELEKEVGPEHMEVVKAKALAEMIHKQIDEQVQFVLRGLEIKRLAAKKTAEMLQAQSAAFAPPAKNPASGAALVAATSSQAEEVKRIQALIKDSPDLINAPDPKGEMLLQSAAAKGKLAVVKVLLENGAAVEGLQQPGLTPLHYAAANGHKAIVDLLLSKGAKADAQSQSGVTPLHLAAGKGYETVAKALLAVGASVNAQTKGVSSSDSEDLRYHVSAGQSPLHLAASAGYSGMVELLLAKGADANAEDAEGRTALSYAVQHHYQAVLQILLAAHANPNAGRVDLPLATAAYQGDVPALKLLLASGADPNTNSTVNWTVYTRGGQSSQGVTSTPLFLAVIQRKAEAAKELLRCKADPNAIGNPLLYEALSDIPTLKVLLEGGADPNARTSDGKPMLMVAVGEQSQPAVELLLAHDADVNAMSNAENPGGGTPLHMAARIGSTNIAGLLLKSGAAVNARDKIGNTPLHLAVANMMDGHREVAALLLANKADPNARNNTGQTPLDWAKGTGSGQPNSGMNSTIPGAPFGSVPPLSYQWRPTGTPATAPRRESKPESMADLLRRHGAVDDLPQLDGIRVSRRSTGETSTAFTKGSDDWGQFTLLDLIGVQYSFLADSPQDGGGDAYDLIAFFRTFARLPFPDLAHLRIRRPGPDQKSWQEQVVDLRPVLESGDCSKDVGLEWGDVVEIPEADHPLNEKWPGFSKAELANLKKCLTRRVEIVINGQATNITLAPWILNDKDVTDEIAGRIHRHSNAGFPMPAWQAPTMPTIVTRTPFWLKPVLLQSQLVLTSSDLRRVKVTRHDGAGGQQREWVVDCLNASPAPDFWLRDGDRVEVPEKTDSASAAGAPGSQSASPK